MLRWKKQIRNGNITPPSSSKTMSDTSSTATAVISDVDSSESTERISMISPDDGSSRSLATVHPVSDSSTSDSSYYDDEIMSMHGDKCCNGTSKNNNSNSNSNSNSNNEDKQDSFHDKDMMKNGSSSSSSSSFPLEIKLPKLRLKQQQKMPRRISVNNNDDDSSFRLVSKRRKVSVDGMSEGEGEGEGEGEDSAAINSLLLALPSDSNFLNPLHCFIRRNVEVFTATADDIALPAPGRKNRVALGQVGLRCVHCKHMPGKKRIKRAVCYPSSIGRVYHSVSDMKFDHFGACKAMSKDLIQEMDLLKRTCKRHHKIAVTTSSALPTNTSSSTAQYYFDAAKMLGMVDTTTGIFLKDWGTTTTTTTRTDTDTNKPMTLALTSKQQTQLLTSIPQRQRHSRKQHPQPTPTKHVHSSNTTTPKTLIQPSQPTTLHLLALPEDSYTLNPLHCFVRRHTEVFTATKNDLAIPSPGRKNRVTLGQVGLRCVFCSHLPPKDRIKRAVCYPPSVRGIYHSVSNMKFDHFGNCKGIDKETKKEFDSLKAQCCTNMKKRYKTNYSTSSPSTAQYYVAAAERMGLVDTEGGIRFRFTTTTTTTTTTATITTTTKQKQHHCHQTTVPDYKYDYANEYAAQHSVINDNTVSSSSHSDDMDGISALVIAATDPGVRARHEARKGTTSIINHGRCTNSDNSPIMTKPCLPRIVSSSSSSPMQVMQQQQHQPQQPPPPPPPMIQMNYCNYNHANPAERQQIQSHVNSYAVVS